MLGRLRRRGERAQGREVLLALAPVAVRHLARNRRGQLRRVDEGGAVLELAHLAQFLVGELRLRRPAPADDVDVADRRGVNGLGGVIGQIAGRHLGRGLDQHPGDVDGHVAVADDADGRGVQVGIEIAEIRVAVVPADEGGRAVDTGEIGAGDRQLPVERHTGGQDDRVVALAQLRHREVAADLDIAVVTDLGLLGGAREGPPNPLGALVVGRHAAPDQAEGRGQGVDDVDLGLDA